MFESLLQNDTTENNNIDMLVKTNLTEEGKHISFRKAARENEIKIIVKNFFKLNQEEEYIPIFIGKDRFTQTIPEGATLFDIHLQDSTLLLFQKRFVQTKIQMPGGNEQEITLDISQPINLTVSLILGDILAPIRDYYTLFSLDNPNDPIPLNPKKPVFHSTLYFDKFIFGRYIYVFPPRIISSVDVAWTMFYDCRKYLFDHKEMEIEHSDLVALAVFDCLATDSDSLMNGSFDLTKHIPPRFGFSYAFRDEVFSSAKTNKTKDLLSILKGYIKIARSLPGFGVKVYSGKLKYVNNFNGFATAELDPFGITFYDKDHNKILKKISYNLISEIGYGKSTQMIAFYNRTTRKIDQLEFFSSNLSQTLGMHIINTIDVIDKELKESSKDSKEVETATSLPDLISSYSADYKKLTRKLEYVYEIANKDTLLDDAYENIASFYRFKCEISKALRKLGEKSHIIADASKKSGQDPPVLEDLIILKQRFKEINDKFLDTREKMRETFLNNENKVQSYTTCIEKIMNGVETIKGRWENGNRALEEERVGYADKLLQILTFYLIFRKEDSNSIRVMQNMLFYHYKLVSCFINNKLRKIKVSFILDYLLD